MEDLPQNASGVAWKKRVGSLLQIVIVAAIVPTRLKGVFACHGSRTDDLAKTKDAKMCTV
jgi:hypothetical protein